MTKQKTPEQLARSQLIDQQYKELENDESIDDFWEFTAHRNICLYGVGQDGRVIDDEQLIVESFADLKEERTDHYKGACVQGKELLTRKPFPWLGLGYRTELLAFYKYNEEQVREWLERQVKLLEAEGRKRGWIK